MAKIRCGFISNSSSSSFIILEDINIIPRSIKCKELNVEQKKRVCKQGFIYDQEVKEQIWLTEFCSDDCDVIYDFFYTDKRDKDGIRILNELVKIYQYGDHGCPYNKDDYEEIDTDIWLSKGENKLEIS